VTERPSITLIQRVPDAAWFERLIREWKGDPWPVKVAAFASHLRGNLSPNADAVLVDGPTLKAVLEAALPGTGYVDALRSINGVSPSSWRRGCQRMLESLKEVGL